MTTTAYGYMKYQTQACLRLFCFSYAGGSASLFRLWPGRLSAAIDVCPVELPGHGTRLKEAPISRLGPLIESLAGTIYPSLDRPFALFGHSMGALISFELARYLRRAYGQFPEHLFISAYRAPHLLRPPAIARSTLSDADLIKKLRELGGTPEEILQQPELLRLILPTLRADFQICDTYSYQAEAPLSCPITVLGGLRDRIVNGQELDAWRMQTTARFRRYMFPGHHFFLESAQTLLFTLFEQVSRTIMVEQLSTSSG